MTSENSEALAATSENSEALAATSENPTSAAPESRLLARLTFIQIHVETIESQDSS